MMTEQWPSGTEFIDRWLNEMAEAEEVDDSLIAQIKRYWRGGTLNEDALLKGIIRMSSDETQAHGDD